MAVVLGMTLTGEEGLLRRSSVQGRLSEMEARVARVEAENEVMRAKIRRLREDPAAIEREAATQLLVGRPGSVIYRFADGVGAPELVDGR